MNELGEIRPSQLIFTFGVGSLLDLPNISALVMGLDDWDTRYCREIGEDRLLVALQRRLGGQLSKLYLPPIQFVVGPGPVSQPIGVPVCPFPRWLRCPFCDTLATIDSGVFQLRQDPYRPDKTRYVHAGCTKVSDPTALSVRFLLACREGHLSDFPWIDYVHTGIVPCKPARLTLREYGASGDASDVIVKCIECGKERRMGEAFDKDSGGNFKCPAHHPHLRTIEQDGCKETARAILLGASNSWFAQVMSALSIPRAGDKLAKLVEERWIDLKDIPSIDVARYVTAPSRMPAFAEFTTEQIWDSVLAKRKRDSEPPSAAAEDLKTPEWEVLSAADPSNQSSDFRLQKVDPPLGFENYFEDTVLVERIREVRALLGFNRIESNGDFADVTTATDGRRTPLSRSDPTWLPAAEVRGEGIFIRLREEAVASWESKSEVQQLATQFFASHCSWRKLRNIRPEQSGFPGMRFILLHSLAHAFMRQIVLDCGYTAASIRERIYCRLPSDPHGSMAGFLIYTAATDSEGTLGGLVDLGKPISLGRNLQQSLENLRICASDPLCSEHPPSNDGRSIHAASCHACLFAPETSCERGNRYLDRGSLVLTVSPKSTAFFEV